MKLEKWSFKITGITPLLTANPANMEVDTGGVKTKKAKNDTPEEEAQKGVYMHDGKYCLPAIAFRSALLSACTGKKVGKASAKSFIAPSVVHSQDWCVIFDSKGKPFKEYQIDRRRVVNPNTGGSRIRHRPMFEGWATVVEFEVDTDMLPSKSQLAELLEEAGAKIGVGDYRPSCMGWFGKFKAEIST